MTSILENVYPWAGFFVESINKLTWNVVNLVTSTLGITCNSTDIRGDELIVTIADSFNEFVAFLSFDDFQLQLLKIFLIALVSNIALIYVAWHIYGTRITERFMKQSAYYTN